MSGKITEKALLEEMELDRDTCYANVLLTIFVYHTCDEKNYEWLPHYPLCHKQEICIYLKNTRLLPVIEI